MALYYGNPLVHPANNWKPDYVSQSSGFDIGTALLSPVGQQGRVGNLSGFGLPTNILQDILRGAGNLIQDPLRAAGGALQGPLRDAGNVVQDIVRDVAAPIQEPLRDVGGAIQDATRYVGGVLQEPARDIGGAIRDVTRDIGGVLQEPTRALGDAAQDALRGVGNLVEPYVDPVIDAIRKAADPLAEMASRIAQAGGVAYDVVDSLMSEDYKRKLLKDLLKGDLSFESVVGRGGVLINTSSPLTTANSLARISNSEYVAPFVDPIKDQIGEFLAPVIGGTTDALAPLLDAYKPVGDVLGSVLGDGFELKLLSDVLTGDFGKESFVGEGGALFNTTNPITKVGSVMNLIPGGQIIGVPLSIFGSLIGPDDSVDMDKVQRLRDLWGTQLDANLAEKIEGYSNLGLSARARNDVIPVSPYERIGLRYQPLNALTPLTDLAPGDWQDNYGQLLTASNVLDMLGGSSLTDEDLAGLYSADSLNAAYSDYFPQFSAAVESLWPNMDPKLWNRMSEQNVLDMARLQSDWLANRFGGTLGQSVDASDLMASLIGQYDGSLRDYLSSKAKADQRGSAVDLARQYQDTRQFWS